MTITTSVKYRLLQPKEEGAVLDLWCELFLDTNRERWHQQFIWDPHRFQRTHIAILSDGTVLGTIRYFIRAVRNKEGNPVTVGWVTNVATKAEAQRQGHGGKLLTLTLEAMRREGCRWSLLSADEEAVGFYERYGWRRFPLQYRQGLLAESHLPSSNAYSTRRFDPLQQANGWEQVAAVYEKYNRMRPLTVVRDGGYWQGYITMRMADWQRYAGAELIVAAPVAANAKVNGYAVAIFSEMGVLICELCVQADAKVVSAALFNAIQEELRRRNLPSQGRVYLPHELYLDSAIETFFDATLHDGFDTYLLARTIADDCEESEISATFAAPNAIHWLLDDY